METITQNAFVKASKKERRILATIFAKCNVKDIEYSDEEGNARWDFKFTSKSDKPYIGDIKCRNIAHNKYDDVLIESKKVEWLVKEAKKTDSVPILICSYTDDIALIWDLTNVPSTHTKQVKRCPETTCGSRRWVNKDVYFLDVKAGKKIQLTNQKAKSNTDKSTTGNAR